MTHHDKNYINALLLTGGLLGSAYISYKLYKCTLELPPIKAYFLNKKLKHNLQQLEKEWQWDCLVLPEISDMAAAKDYMRLHFDCCNVLFLQKILSKIKAHNNPLYSWLRARINSHLGERTDFKLQMEQCVSRGNLNQTLDSLPTFLDNHFSQDNGVFQKECQSLQHLVADWYRLKTQVIELEKICVHRDQRLLSLFVKGYKPYVCNLDKITICDNKYSFLPPIKLLFAQENHNPATNSVDRIVYDCCNNFRNLTLYLGGAITTLDAHITVNDQLYIACAQLKRALDREALDHLSSIDRFMSGATAPKRGKAEECDASTSNTNNAHKVQPDEGPPPEAAAGDLPQPHPSASEPSTTATGRGMDGATAQCPSTSEIKQPETDWGLFQKRLWGDKAPPFVNPRNSRDKGPTPHTPAQGSTAAQDPTAAQGFTAAQDSTAAQGPRPALEYTPAQDHAPAQDQGPAHNHRPLAEQVSTLERCMQLRDQLQSTDPKIMQLLPKQHILSDTTRALLKQAEGQYRDTTRCLDLLCPPGDKITEEWYLWIVQ